MEARIVASDGSAERVDVEALGEALQASDAVAADLADDPDEPSAWRWGELARRLELPEELPPWFGSLDGPVEVEVEHGTVGVAMPIVDGEEITRIHAWANEDVLVVVRRGAAGLVDELCARIGHDRPADGVVALFMLLETAAETFRQSLGDVFVDVEAAEERILDGPRREHVGELAALRRRVGGLHRGLSPYSESLQSVKARLPLREDLPRRHARLVRTHAGDMAAVEQTFQEVEGATDHALDTYTSLVATQQNSVINRLTIVSAVFLPLTYLAGFFGMNFQYLRDQTTSAASFWVLALGLQGLFLAAALILLWRIGVWRGAGGGGDPVNGDRPRRRSTHGKRPVAAAGSPPGPRGHGEARDDRDARVGVDRSG